MSGNAPIVKHLCLIGAGLIGSSLARAARRYNASAKITIYDASEPVRTRVAELALADHVAMSAASAVRDADLVILCVPMGAYEAVSAEMSSALKPGAIVSDVGSVKGTASDVLRAHLPAHVALVPAHPVAGTEFSGPDAGFADLFEKRWCILTPDEATPQDAVQLVRQFWHAVGAEVDVMSAAHHDRVLAMTSHIPHLIAYNIVGTAHDLEQVAQKEVIKYSAGGFRDFTRIAASDPVMWRDIFLANKQAVLDVLGRFSDDLSMLQKAIRNEDGETLHAHFTRTRAIRKAIVDAGQETAAADFGRSKSKES